MTLPTPWWASDPVIAEIRRRTAEEFGIDLATDDVAERGLSDDSDDSDDPDDHDPEDFDPEDFGPEDFGPVMSELLTGDCRRELAAARDALAMARCRYDIAVVAARTAGFSWAEIGNVLGVSKQLLHRRFRTRQRGRP